MSQVKQHHLAPYLGELKNGRMHGYGIYWYTSGTRYEGEFKDGMFHGKGMSAFAL